MESNYITVSANVQEKLHVLWITAKEGDCELT
jgi:hypothetical protein